MSVKSAADLMIMLLYAKGKSGEYNEPIRGITRMEKLMYLLLKEGGFEETLKNELNFEAYDYGPYSAEIYDIIEALKEIKILKVMTEKKHYVDELFDGLRYDSDIGEPFESKDYVEIYSLTDDKGMKIASILKEKRVSEKELKNIENIKKKYNKMNLKELLRYVYETYPQSAKKSKIIADILGFGKRPSLKPFEREGDGEEWGS